MGCDSVYDLTPEEIKQKQERRKAKRASDMAKKSALASSLVSALASSTTRSHPLALIKAIDAIIYNWPKETF
jgi:hypothetical protein